MKELIKQILRENMEMNSLGVSVSRPNQELIVMRGIPGSGKSTKAKTLVGNGIIHSTDDLIEKSGDYRAFFEKMIANKNFAPLSYMHTQNLKNAIESMKNGITPVIIDNTNIKKSEPKAYVVAALEMGYADANIKFVDVGTGGLDADGLAKRNTHGVPVDKIKDMMASHASIKEMTLEGVLGAKDFYTEAKVKNDVLYSAVVLDTASHNTLLTTRYPVSIPSDWKVFAHHMTIALGKPVKDAAELGKTVTLRVTKIGVSDMAIAVAVEGYVSNNTIPHITLAVNPNGGKPAMSKEITKWQDIKPFYITGIITDVKAKETDKIVDNEKRNN